MYRTLQRQTGRKSINSFVNVLQGFYLGIYPAGLAILDLMWCYAPFIVVLCFYQICCLLSGIISYIEAPIAPLNFRTLYSELVYFAHHT
jgi:hypothetical protein